MSTDPNVDYAAIADRVYIEGWALALTFGAVDQWNGGRWISTVVCGVLSAVLQFAVIKWSAWLKANPDNRLFAKLHDLIPNPLVWIATMAFFLMFISLSPFVQENRLPFASLFSAKTVPSADEIAEAVVHHLPNGIVAAPVTTASHSADNRKNPLNDASAKLNFMQSLSDFARKNVIPKCKVLIDRYQLPYAEQFSDDLKSALTIMDWPFIENFALSEVPRGLSIENTGEVNSQKCGAAFENSFGNATNWRGGTWSVPRLETPKDSTRFIILSGCGNCIYVEIGNDPDQQ